MTRQCVRSIFLDFLPAAALFAIATQFASAQLLVTNYGAKCNWNGTSGTDDTAAFQAASTAGSNLYSVNGSVASVLLPVGQSCVVGGTVTIGSGVLFEGPGTIVVPNQTGSTLQFQNADNAGAEHLFSKLSLDLGGTTRRCRSLAGLQRLGTANHTATLS